MLGCACGLRLSCGHRVVGCAGGLRLGCVCVRGFRERDWRRRREPVGSTTFGAVRHGNKEAQKWRADTSGLTRNGYGPWGSLDRPSGTDFKLRF